MAALKYWIYLQYADARQTSLSTHALEPKIEKLSNGPFRRLGLW